MQRARLPTWSALRSAWTADLAISALLVAVAAAVAIVPFHAGLFSEADAVMLLFLAITGAAVWRGRAGAIAAALLSVATFDFFFVPPFHTFAVASSRHLLTFAMMFACGLFLSGLTGRLRQQEEEVATRSLQARAEQLRSTLLSAVSHDLRTPLASILGAATTLRDEGTRLPDSARTALLDDIAAEAARLERLVGNLLDMTRVQSGQLALKKEWVPTDEVIGSALQRVEERLAGRPVTVTLSPAVPLLEVDPVLFEQVLVNLLENAARHTPAASPVEIRVEPETGGAVVLVQDRGPGLPAGLDVFEKFVRGPDAPAGGAGLGLAICRGIAVAHGGTIAAAARPDGGAVLSVHLPLGAPPAWSTEVP